MTKEKASMILSLHLMQCGSMMPIEWVQKNGEDSEFMQAYKMAMDALKNAPDDFCSYGERKDGDGNG